MTLPNKITFFRLILTVIAILFFYLGFPYHYLWSLACFLLAMILDYLDGYLARQLNQVTELGAFLDPLVDKITIMAFLVCLVDQQLISAWLALLLIFRDIGVSSFRSLGMAKGISIPARYSGKFKTLFQIFGIALGLLTIAQTNFLNYSLGLHLTFYTLLVALIISYVSGLLIIARNYRKVFE